MQPQVRHGPDPQRADIARPRSRPSASRPGFRRATRSRTRARAGYGLLTTSALASGSGTGPADRAHRARGFPSRRRSIRWRRRAPAGDLLRAPLTAHGCARCRGPRRSSPAHTAGARCGSASTRGCSPTRASSWREPRTPSGGRSARDRVPAEPARPPATARRRTAPADRGRARCRRGLPPRPAGRGADHGR